MRRCQFDPGLGPLIKYNIGDKMATRTYDYARSIIKAKYYDEYLDLYHQLIAGLKLEYLNYRDRNRICMKYKTRAVSTLVRRYPDEYMKLTKEAYAMGLPNK
jgi:hypothetical protein